MFTFDLETNDPKRRRPLTPLSPGKLSETSLLEETNSEISTAESVVNVRPAEVRIASPR